MEGGSKGMPAVIDRHMDISPEIMAELDAILHHYTKTMVQIDKLGRTLFNDKAEKYRDAKALTSWDSLLKMLIDNYWNNSERLDEADLISTFETSKI
jgi:uncharacterized Ntn-hydrolase superfamily protein